MFAGLGQLVGNVGPSVLGPRLSGGVSTPGVQVALPLQVIAAGDGTGDLLHRSGHSVQCFLSYGFHVGSPFHAPRIPVADAVMPTVAHPTLCVCRPGRGVLHRYAKQAKEFSCDY